MKATIIVNRRVLARNQKTGEREPAISIRTYKGVEYAKEIQLTGDSWRLIQDDDKPICSGARVWIVGKRENLKIVK